MSNVRISVNLRQFKDQLRAEADKLNRATRPAAQAGAQVIYDGARLLAPESERPHMFHGTHAVYGPYNPGNLRDSIYQVFSKDKSFKDISTYHISWNADKAPYGAMVEFGTSTAPAYSFIGRSIKENRPHVKQAMKQRYIEEVEK
jgi:HK97 gp10 family phage protein